MILSLIHTLRVRPTREELLRGGLTVLVSSKSSGRANFATPSTWLHSVSSMRRSLKQMLVRAKLVSRRLIHGVNMNMSPRMAVMEAYSQHPLKVLWPAQMLASTSPVNKSQGYDCGISPTNACAGRAQWWVSAVCCEALGGTS